MQRSAGDTKRGMDQLLPPGLGKEQHIRTSMDLQTLFSQRSPMDPDLELAADAGNAKFNKIWNDCLTNTGDPQEKLMDIKFM